MVNDPENINEDSDSDKSDPFQRINIVEDNARREPLSIELTYPLGTPTSTGDSEHFKRNILFEY